MNCMKTGIAGVASGARLVAKRLFSVVFWLVSLPIPIGSRRARRCTNISILVISRHAPGARARCRRTRSTHAASKRALSERAFSTRQLSRRALASGIVSSLAASRHALLSLALTSCAGEAGSPVPLWQTRILPVQAPVDAARKLGSSKDNQYTLFEAGPVRPVAVGRDGLVAVTNIPDDRLELFRPSTSGVEPCGSVFVGARPVAVAAVGTGFWVVNHLSDSVSIVSVDAETCAARVEQTLLVGDEPRDVVAATAPDGRSYVFVTAAHRGQNVTSADGSYRDPQLTTPGLGRADVFVFDEAPAPSGAPLTILTLFTDSPRALAVAGDRVYAAGFLSGNRTSVVKYQLLVDKGRRSLAALDADGDQVIDASLPPEARRVSGGYPAVKGHGRCMSAQTSGSPANLPLNFDFYMDVCVQTDPLDPTRAIAIVPQVAGSVTPQCACTSSRGELQVMLPLIVRFFDDPALCGASFDTTLGGCWLEPPSGPGAPAASAGAFAWNTEIAFSLPDRDVFAIDLSQSPPALAPEAALSGVGSVLFNMAAHPKTGKLFVSNTDARNLVRFEGPGLGVPQGERFADTSVRGHTVESRISVLDPRAGSVHAVHLNEHVDYSACCAATPNAESERSLAFPLGLAISSRRGPDGELGDDQDLFVAAFGSDKVAVLSTARLENAAPGEPVQDVADHIEVPGGPAGLALDEARSRLYVFTRFDNALAVIDSGSRTLLESHPMYTPEPERVKRGRPFLYDARRTSSHGDTACASCHVFGDLDALSWDLGAPDSGTLLNTGPFIERAELVSPPLTSNFLSVKGPMSTQSLRGLANHGPMHWRGDRSGGHETTLHAQPDVGALDEAAAFEAFNVAFPGLLGLARELSAEELQTFTDFALDITYPPNPIRSLDDVLTPHQERALTTYFGCETSQASLARGECLDGRNIAAETFACTCAVTPRFALGLEAMPAGCPPDPVCTLNLADNFQTCNGCHTLDRHANAEHGVDKPGFFGSNGHYSSDAVPHMLKVPQFRNLYQRVGMFGTVQTVPGIGLNDIPDSPFGQRVGGLVAPHNGFTGEQIRGFGFTHAGDQDTIFHFTSSLVFVRSLGPVPAPLIASNAGGFEPFLPRDAAACFDGALPALNAEFVAGLAPEETLQALRAGLSVLLDPAVLPEVAEAAQAALDLFLAVLPPDSPGKVFESLGAAQLALPLLACPALPDAATLEAHGCLRSGDPTGCPDLYESVRNCALWGHTLEQLLGGTSESCRAEGLEQRESVEDFLLAFDTNLAPSVGQQVTLRASSSGDAAAFAERRLALLLEQARLGRCDVVAHSGDRGAVFENGEFLRDDGLRDTQSGLLAGGASVTFTAVPPGEGRRSGIDRDLNGTPDALER